MSAEHSVMAMTQTKEAPGRANPINCRYLRFGPFQIDRLRQQLSKNGLRVKLYGKAYQVLLLLLESPGEIVTREQIRQRLWHAESDVNVDANINTTVNRIRLILKGVPGSPAYIDTIPRKGYSFVGQVEMTDSLRTGAAAAPGEESTDREQSSEKIRPTRRFFKNSLVKTGIAAIVFLAIALGFLAGFYWTSVAQARNVSLFIIVVLAVALIFYRTGQSIASRAGRARNS
jgi:DNA-binding winged helix-turn-helix (wHTH) protein